MKYKLSDIASIAEIIGAVAIVLSLIFVGVQLKDSTRATRSATANEAISTLTAWYAEIGTDEQTSSLFWNAMADPEARTPEEWFQFTMVFHGIMLTFQNSFYLANEGTLDEEIHQSMTEVLVGVKDQPGLRRYWGQRKSIFYRDFQDYVDSILAVERRVSDGIYKDMDPQ